MKSDLSFVWGQVHPYNLFEPVPSHALDFHLFLLLPFSHRKIIFESISLKQLNHLKGNWNVWFLEWSFQK